MCRSNKVLYIFSVLFWFHSALLSQQSSDLPRKALELLNQDRPGEAEKVFREYLEFHPEDSEAAYYLAVSLHLQSKYEEAVKLLEHVLARLPTEGSQQLTPSRLRYQIGLLYFQMGNLELAKEWIEPLLKDQAPAPTHFLLGRVYFQQKDYISAERHISKALELGLANPAEAYYYLGLVQAAQENFAKAVPFFEQAVRHEPSHADFLLAFAEASFQVRDVEAVERLSRNVLKENPHSAAALYNLGQAAYIRGNFEQARDYLIKATEQEKRPEYFNSLAQVCIRLQEPNLAIKALEENVRLDPDGLSARLQLAALLFQTGPTGRAEQAYLRLLEKDPRNIQGLFGLAFTLVVEGKETEAVRVFRQAWETDSHQVQEMIASTVLATQEEPDYIEIAKRLLQALPSESAAHSFEILVAKKYISAGAPEKALEWANRSADPTHPTVHLVRGTALRMLGRYDLASKELSAVAPSTEESVASFYQLALLFWEKSEYDVAGKYLDRVLSASPGQFPALILKAKIQTEHLDLDKAEETLKTALKLGADRPEVYYQFFLVYQRAGRELQAKQALAEYEKRKQESLLPLELKYP